MIMNMYEDLVQDDKSSSAMLKIEQKKKEKEHDVFLRYGTGIVNYFVLQERLIRLFCGLSVLAILQLLIYNYFDGHNYTSKETNYTKISFGNMGYSGSICGTNFIDWTQDETIVRLQC